MNNTSVSMEIIEGIYDIQPHIPATYSRLEIIVAITLAILLTTTIIWRQFISQKAQAKRRILKLQQQHSNKKIDSHMAVYKLCELLQSGMNVKQFNNTGTLPSSLSNKSNEWHHFHQQLNSLRYKKNQSNHDLDSIFTESLSWLKQWP